MLILKVESRLSLLTTNDKMPHSYQIAVLDLIRSNSLSGNSLEKTKKCDLTKTVADLNFAKFVTKIMVTNIFVTKFIGLTVIPKVLLTLGSEYKFNISFGNRYSPKYFDHFKIIFLFKYAMSVQTAVFPNFC